jgi:hypothetical protein
MREIDEGGGRKGEKGKKNPKVSAVVLSKEDRKRYIPSRSSSLVALKLPTILAKLPSLPEPISLSEIALSFGSDLRTADP